MTAAPLHLAAPTAPERALLRLASALTTTVEHRRELRADRDEVGADEVVHRQDPRELDIALLALGSRPRD